MSLKENNNFQWFVHLPFLSEEQCDNLLHQVKDENGWSKAKVVNPSTNEKKVSKYRKCDELFLRKDYNQDIKNDYDWILKKLDTIVRITNSRIWNFNIERPSGDFRTIQYKIGDHFDWHSETDAGVLSLNKITCLIQLSDPKDFDGGDLHFALKDGNGEFQKAPYKKGYLFMFPSFCSHMVTPLKSGERFIMRQTYLGEPFR